MPLTVTAEDADWPIVVAEPLQVQEDGVTVASHPTLNFESGITATANPDEGRIDVSVDADAGLALAEAGTPLPARSALNFGAGLVATDNPAQDRTDLTVSSGSSVASGVITPEQYGAVGDVVNLADASIAATQAVVTSPTYTFTQADVGKLFGIERAVTINTANPFGVLLTTIQSVTAGAATLAASATLTITGNGKCSFGTDDTAELNAFFAALSGTKTGIGAGNATMRKGILSGQYATSAMINDGGGHYSLEGIGIAAPWNLTSHGPTIQDFPYLVGACVVVFASGLTAAISSSGAAQQLRWKDIGIRFVKAFVTTGHGHLAMAPVVPSQTYHQAGVAQSIFENVHVYGHDGSSYGLRHVNSYRNLYLRPQAAGGGGVSTFADNQNYLFGNHTFVDPENHIFLAGGTHGLDFSTGNGASQTSAVVIRPNLFMSNQTGNYYPTTAPATAASKFWKFPAAGTMKGFSMIGPSIESSTIPGATFDWPAPSDIDTAYSGFSFDVGGFMYNADDTLKPPQIVNSSAYGKPEFHRNNTRHITTATDAMAAGWKSAPYSTYDSTANPITVTLPTGSVGLPQGELLLMKTSSDANVVTINASGGNKFYNSTGPTSITLTTQGSSVRIVWNGSFLMPYQKV